MPTYFELCDIQLSIHHIIYFLNALHINEKNSSRFLTLNISRKIFENDY